MFLFISYLRWNGEDDVLMQRDILVFIWYEITLAFLLVPIFWKSNALSKTLFTIS